MYDGVTGRLYWYPIEWHDELYSVDLFGLQTSVIRHKQIYPCTGGTCQLDCIGCKGKKAAEEFFSGQLQDAHNEISLTLWLTNFP